jgi:predicted ribosomally synthesized peptide with nif11-like leader
MSQERAQEFIRRIGTERGFLRLLDNLKSKDDLLKAARVCGYDFTADELKTAIVRTMDLQEADLRSVTGGVGVSGYGELLWIANLLGI